MNGWSSYQNKCIKLFEDKIFSDAKNFCESLNATLISIHSTQENDFVLNLVQKQSHVIVWIGGKRNSANNFEWINKNAFNYTNWFSGQQMVVIMLEWIERMANGITIGYLPPVSMSI